MMQSGQVLTKRTVQPLIRVCSGACPFFEPEYVMGRKVAGTGACEKHRGGTIVHVGHPCLWPRSDKQLLIGPTMAMRPQRLG